MNAELYLDEDRFNAIFEAIRDGVASIDVVRVSIAAELFEEEVQASLSEWWMAREYGMIKKGDWVQTRARLDSIHVGFGKKTEQVTMMDNGEDEEVAPLTNPPKNSAEIETRHLLRTLIKRSGWILAAIAALLVVTLLK